MAYAVVQTGLEAPRMEQLKAAFKGVPGLTPMDAPILCRDAFGILVKGFELERANALQTSLAAQGLETEVVEEKSLPVLPETRHMIRVECTPDALVLQDQVGKSFPLDWKSILMIAAGRVPIVEFKRTATAMKDLQDGGGLELVDKLLFKGNPPGVARERSRSDARVKYETKEERRDHWLAEIVMRDGGMRYSLDGENPMQVLFQYQGSRRRDDLAANFRLMVQDFCQFAPGATINRGAYYLRENGAAGFGYPGKTAFYEEMVWLMWKLRSKN